MVGRGKADEVGIFHVSESSLDVMLAAIAKDDFFVGADISMGSKVRIWKKGNSARHSAVKWLVGW
jgi:hypothetical protein